MSGHIEQHEDSMKKEAEDDEEAGLNAGKDETPLFLSDSSEGKKGNAQDEKDETAE